MGPPDQQQFVAVAGSRGSITLPADLRRRYHLDEPGAQVEVIGRPDGVIELHPVLPPALTRHGFGPSAGRRWSEVDEHIAAGGTRVSDSIEEMFEDIDAATPVDE